MNLSKTATYEFKKILIRYEITGNFHQMKLNNDIDIIDNDINNATT